MGIFVGNSMMIKISEKWKKFLRSTTFTTTSVHLNRFKTEYFEVFESTVGTSSPIMVNFSSEFLNIFQMGIFVGNSMMIKITEKVEKIYTKYNLYNNVV